NEFEKWKEKYHLSDDFNIQGIENLCTSTRVFNLRKDDKGLYDEGGAYDGWGRKVMDFPDDGHPDMCNAVLDITGDCRDEIVVWDPNEIWVYTQHDNPIPGKLYKPKRNELSNYSNYQASVSLPGWNK
ncbi:hypothetical protein LCGC14_1620610, partial [marine sediment metagenome]